MSESGHDKLRPRDLYIDLLIKSVSNQIYAPFPAQQNRDRAARPVKRERDWQTHAHTMVGMPRLENLRALVQQTLRQGIAGDFIETGVWRGGCCILMRGILAANRVANRKVYVADSFAGLPPPNPDRFPQDVPLARLALHEIPELAVPLEEVKANFARYGLLDDQVVFVEGFFSDTLPKLDAGPFALIRLDGDMYESTFVALECLYPKLSTGGFVIIDDFGALSQCRKAVADYREKMGILDPIREIDWTGVYWRKSGR